MQFAIIAAGEGRRLEEEGVAVAKPLVRLGGETLMERLVRVFSAAAAEEIVVITRRSRPEAGAHVRALAGSGRYAPIRLLEADTPSSMHSFSCLAPLLSGERFCLTTVDTVFKEEDFLSYIRHFSHSTADALMAVTSYVDDEKPLYVAVDKDLRITAFSDEPCSSPYVSGGIYCLRHSALSTLDRCMAEGKSRMRNFQRGLLQDGLRVQAWPFPKIIDVDHACDISLAERFLSSPTSSL